MGSPGSIPAGSDNTDRCSEALARRALSFPCLSGQPEPPFPGWRPLTRACLCFQFYAILISACLTWFVNPQRGRLLPVWKLFTSEFNFLMISQCLIPVINTVLCFWPPPAPAAPLPVHSHLSHIRRLLSHLLLSRQQIISGFDKERVSRHLRWIGT